jgi:membrane fusion protein (multidrug efflux system)
MAALFPNPDHLLRPGQYAKVRVVETKPGALVVPERAISELQGAKQVTVVGPDNKAESRTIVTGDHVGSLWTVEKGLSEGERVVVAGIQKVRPGMIVEPRPASQDAGSAGGSAGAADPGAGGGASASGAAGATGGAASSGASGAGGASRGTR